jgi:polyphosphate kinase
MCLPELSGAERARILRDLNSYLADNTQAWVLGRDGGYTRCSSDGEPRDAQNALLTRYAAGSAPVIAP